MRPPAPPPQLILGLDPGLAALGWGLVRGGEPPQSTGYGVLTTTPDSPTPERLLALHRQLTDIILRYGPTAVAVEDFVGRNLRSALAVGQARGVAILAAAQRGLPVFSYTPLQVKMVVSGYGRGPKEQVQEMTRLQLGLTAVPQPDHAADALAVALCHLALARRTALVEAARQRQD